MSQLLTAPLDAGGRRFALVVSRTNELITGRLLSGALETLAARGAGREAVTVVHVPGAWELALAALKLAQTGGYAAVICLGCVIRGGTPHFEFVAGAAAQGIMQASLKSGVPAAFGVLTTDTLEQALDRAGGKHGNKGAEAALAALEMANLLPRLAEAGAPSGASG